jgi:tetratricopeptide (TPR) repeat protein
MKSVELQLLWWPMGLILAAVLLIGVHQFFLAAVFTAYALFYATTKTAPSMLTRTTSWLIARGKYRQAEALAKFGLDWCRVLKIENIANLPRSISWDMLMKSDLALSLLQQGRFDESVKIDQELLQVLETENDVDGTAKIMGHMAFCYVAQGKLKEAGSLLDRVIPILESASRNAESSHDIKARIYRTRLMSALFEKGTLLETKRDFIGAELIRRRALDLCNGFYEGEDNINAMPHMSMLGKVLIRLGKYEEAEKLLNTVYAVRSKKMPAESLLIASAKLGLGRLYCATDRLADADTYLSEALKVSQKIAGDQHPDIPNYKDDLANLRIKQGKYKEAETLLLSAIEQKERQGNLDHPGLIDMLLNLCELYTHTGRLPEAEAAQQRADLILASLTK